MSGTGLSGRSILLDVAAGFKQALMEMPPSALYVGVGVLTLRVGWALFGHLITEPWEMAQESRKVDAAWRDYYAEAERQGSTWESSGKAYRRAERMERAWDRKWGD